MTSPVLKSESLDEIIRRCGAEAQRSRTEELGYCFELFRRALEEQVQPAWSAIESQYGRLILKWIYDSSSGGMLEAEEVEALKFQALEKFWRTLTRRPMHLASRFEHVGALLRYLQQCAVTTLLDRRRKEQRLRRLQDRLEQEQALDAFRPGVSQSVLEQVAVEERLNLVRSWVQANVSDAQELLVLRLSFEADLSPAEIAAHYPDDFQDVQDVRRVKERVLKRAKRSLSGV